MQLRRFFLLFTCLFLVASLAASAYAQAGAAPDDSKAARKAAKGDKGGKRGGGGKRDVALPADVAALKPLSLVLGCPTDKSMTVNVLATETSEGYIEYGTTAGSYAAKTDKFALTAGKPADVAITGLKPNTAYVYRLRWHKMGDSAYVECAEHSFHTQRSPGSAFIFEIQGDSHPERLGKQYDPVLYAQTLKAAESDKPDFYMTIGDDFSVDTLGTVDAASVDGVYLNQRLFLSLIGRCAPVFLVNGNHEQAAMANLDGTASNVAVWAQNSRNSYFPEPAPDSFYTGDAGKVDHIGFLRDYYAWTWGDALFVVIDPYWHSAKPVDNVFGGGEKNRDLWNVTLGDAQYKWFKETLEKSKAKFKFVFTHHVLGTGRGGIEQAGLCEWGGKDKRGEPQFAAQRPGWDLPIHQLMAKNKVTIFFQGHDHIFVRQQLDGVVYQSLPVPADPNYSLFNADAYTTGDKLANSGRVRVTVSPASVRVEYVRSYLPADQTATQKDNAVAYSYTVSADGKVTIEANRASEVQPAKQSLAAASSDPPQQSTFKTDVPEHPYDLILTRPTDKSITASVLVYEDAEGYIAYGTIKGSYPGKTDQQTFKKGEPAEIRLASLKSGTRYYYRFRCRKAGSKDFTEGPECTFVTQRKIASEFTFTVIADSHLDEHTSPELYSRTLASALADSPDFHIDLGDTFMTEKHRTPDAAIKQYLAQRYYFGLIGGSAPVFLTLGNHDGETAREMDGTSGSLGVWANATRKRYFPMPVPGGFYSGDSTKNEFAGFLEDYYSWTWGDALFVVLDPFWFSPVTRGGEENWKRTLGSEQYKWLKSTLEGSKAKYKFVFLHNLVGGLDKDARGGVEAASLYEWGGHDPDGKDAWKSNRPDWPAPIHKLLVDNHVSAVFHGHDHLFAKQELDGVIYQEVPQPGFEGREPPDKASQAGYKTGEILPGSGYMRIKVTPTAAKVDFVRLSPTKDVPCSYTIKPR